MAKVKFTMSMLRRGDVLINRNGDVKEWRGGDGNLGYIYETKSKTLGYGRGRNKDLLTNQINMFLKSSNGFKKYDIVKVIRQGIVTEINA